MLGFDYQKITQHNRFKNDFEDLDVIGTGGFAEVRRVRNKLDGKLYAAKIIKIKPGNDEDQAQEKLYRALSEVKIHSQLHHSQILKYHGSWIQLLSFSEEEKAEMLEEDKEQGQFQMVLCDDSFGSDGIVFGSASTPKQKQADKSWKNKSQQRSLGDGKKLIDYKEVQIYILTQLCQMNLQTFLYQRNLQKTSHNNESQYQRFWIQNYQIALDITKGLAYLHSQRIIHRDIKLHNIIVNDKRKTKLIDFGIARKAKYWKSSIQENVKSTTLLSSNQEQQFSKSVGTKLFSSPQQATSQKYDYRTDIFSLAMVIVLLFCSFTTAHQQRELIQLIRSRKLQSINMPQQLKDIMYRCLGPQNQRPSLCELTLTLRQLLKQKKISRLNIPLIERNENLHKNFRHHIKLNDLKIH